jgi:hypothetical protein
MYTFIVAPEQHSIFFQVFIIFDDRHTGGGENPYFEQNYFASSTNNWLH